MCQTPLCSAVRSRSKPRAPRFPACRGAFNALMRELILDHVEHHLVHSDEASKEIRDTGKEIQEIVKSFLK